MPPAPAPQVTDGPYTSFDPFHWDPFPMPTFLVTPSAATPTSSNWVDPLTQGVPAPPKLPVWAIVLMAVSLGIGFLILCYYAHKSSKPWSAKLPSESDPNRKKLSFSQTVEKMMVIEMETKPIAAPPPAYTGNKPATQSYTRSDNQPSPKDQALRKSSIPRVIGKLSDPPAYLTSMEKKWHGFDDESALRESITHANTRHNKHKDSDVPKPYIAPSRKRSAQAASDAEQGLPPIVRPQGARW
ncbi:hypothetical protein R3P38DRAFT_1346565 [Favolaschia claudopus]|uniref:Uncharacterized protein n=1 Tax=Favolaschia claudopus TaxID=2862362 RepID=A0AAW0DUV8_9AGAR